MSFDGSLFILGESSKSKKWYINKSQYIINYEKPTDDSLFKKKRTARLPTICTSATKRQYWWVFPQANRFEQVTRCH